MGIYREWFRRTWSGKIGRAQSISGLATIAAASIVLAGKKYPAVAAVVFFAAFLVTLVLGFFLAPYDMFAEQAEQSKNIGAQLEKLEAERIPRLGFSANLRNVNFPGLPPGALLYRLGIENLSNVRVSNMQAKIIAATDLGGREPVVSHDHRLRDTDGEAEWRLNPTSTKYVDFAATRPEKNPPRLYFGPYTPGFSTLYFQNAGVYSVTVEISCAAGRPVEKQITLKFDGSKITVVPDVVQ